MGIFGGFRGDFWGSGGKFFGEGEGKKRGKAGREDINLIFFNLYLLFLPVVLYSAEKLPLSGQRRDTLHV